MALAVVRDLRAARTLAGEDELAEFETDLLAGFVLARASAGLTDGTIRGDVSHLEQVREWFGRPLWELVPADVDRYFATALRGAPSGTRLARAAALGVYFEFVELRHKVELHALTGRVVECPIDEMNRPRGSKDAKLRIPPRSGEIETLFRGWAEEMATCRKYAPTARNYTVARLLTEVGLRVNEARRLDLDDIKWDLGPFGKLHVRHGKGSRGSGPKERMVPLVNNAGRTLRWFIEDVWGHFNADHTRPGTPLFPSERVALDGSAVRVGYDALRAGLVTATAAYLPNWTGRLTPHVLRHYCASQLYLDGVDLISIQEMLGHRWVATTMRYVHIHRSRVEQAWLAGQDRAARRLTGLVPGPDAHHTDDHADRHAAVRPRYPWLHRALHLAHRHAEAHGWSPVLRRAAQRVLTALLAEHRPGDLVLASAAQLTANKACVNAATIVELLDDMDVVLEDRSKPSTAGLSASSKPCPARSAPTCTTGPAHSSTAAPGAAHATPPPRSSTSTPCTRQCWAGRTTTPTCAR